MYPGWSKRWEETLSDVLGNPCWVQQRFRSVWRRANVCWMTRKVTRIESHFSIEKTFTIDPAFNKQNDRVVTFRNNVSERRKLWTSKHPASIMMLGDVALNGEEMVPVWFEREYRLTLRFIKTFWRRYFFHESRRALRNPITSSNRTERKHTRQRIWRTGWRPVLAFEPNLFDTHSHQMWTPSYSAYRDPLEKASKACHSNTNGLKASVNPAWWSMRKGFVRKVC